MAKNQITLFKCGECNWRGQIPINRLEFETCQTCKGKGKVTTIPYRDYTVVVKAVKGEIK